MMIVLGSRDTILVSLLLAFLVGVWSCDEIPSTLDGPFKPVTVPLDRRLHNASGDLPNDDPRLAKPASGYSPEQIGIAQSANSDGMFISWVTGEFQIGANVKPLNPNRIGSVVHYGTSKNRLHYVATGYSTSYSQLYPYPGLNNYTSGIMHHVKLTGLKADHVYYYSCGDPKLGAMSAVFKFKTLPAPGPASYPKRIAIIGDLGLTYNSTTTLKHLVHNNPDLNIFLGDMTYANNYVTTGTGSPCYKCSFPNSPIHETYQPRWDYWGRYLQPIRATIPSMVIEGNHEFELQIRNQTFVSYKTRFAVPAEESGSNTKMYYSFNAGGAHFIMLGAYIDYSKTSEQYAWLVKDLANVDRAVTPWVIVNLHPPWYNSYESHYREVECMKEAMEELLYKNGVDIVIAGHIHAYERTNRVYKYQYDKCAPVHITIGDGGNIEKLVSKHADDPGQCPNPYSTPNGYDMPYEYCGFNFTSGPAAGKFCWDRQPDWSAFRESSFGHGILEIKNSTHALWSWYRNQDAYKHNHVGDQVYIVRQPKVCNHHKHK